jgi:hypothetical protein
MRRGFYFSIGYAERVRNRRLVDTETRLRIEDFFTGTELVDFLQVDVSEIIERFEAEIEEHLDEIEEFI